MPPTLPRFVFDRSPLRVYWELTRSCDLACRHCRAEAVQVRHPDELSTAEGLRVLEQLAAFPDPKPHLVFTGGDPLKRPDLWGLIAAARAFGLRVSVAPSATSLLDATALARLQEAGVEAISLSLDGSTAARHDGARAGGRHPGRQRHHVHLTHWGRAALWFPAAHGRERADAARRGDLSRVEPVSHATARRSVRGPVRAVRVPLAVRRVACAGIRGQRRPLRR